MFLLTITLMGALGLIASDIYLPSLPEICRFFNRSSIEVQGTISIYLLGLSLFQLVYGPLSDSCGRKKPVLIGVMIFFLGTILCVTKINFTFLLAGRFLQGIGACSGMVIGRAILADLYEPAQTSKILTTIFPIIGMSPAISPVIGGYLTRFMGWSSVFVVVAVVSLVLLCLVIFFLQESLPEAKRTRINVSTLMDNYKRVLSERMFIGYTLLVCCAYGTYFAYLSASPFFLKKLGYPADEIGFSYINLSFCYIAGNLTARKLIESWSIDKALKLGVALFIFSLLLMYIFVNISPLDVLSVLMPISILAFANGFLLPLGVGKAITIIPEIKGTASGVMGALQLGSGAVAAYLIGFNSDHSLNDLAGRMLLICPLIFVAIFLVWFEKKPVLKSSISGNH
ncbi:MAG: multidrug effflux MFS transporter [Deltaproteobacteria bacterium]|nr:multidrug effflux MFS transporter [Deltaproteobacteria bacterium]